jgi:hypothetical protein
MLLVNGHGGNADAISDALGKLRAESRDCHVWHAGVLPSMLERAGITVTPDAHAGRVETSMMLALAPGDVRLGQATAGETRPVTEIMAGLRAGGVRQVSPNGVLGDPAGASAAEGEALLTLLAADLAATLDRLTGTAGGAALRPGKRDPLATRRSTAGTDDPSGRRRVDGEQPGRADRAPDELAAAVGAGAAQDGLRAVTAPLVGADKHVGRGRVEVPVATFAVRSQLKHEPSIRPWLPGWEGHWEGHEQGCSRHVPLAADGFVVAQGAVPGVPGQYVQEGAGRG